MLSYLTCCAIFFPLFIHHLFKSGRMVAKSSVSEAPFLASARAHFQCQDGNRRAN
jgi:hypothetical protein